MAKSFKESLQNIQNEPTQTITTDVPMLMMLDPDTEPEITVDMDNRIMTVPKELQNVGVVDDNNAETVYIRIPSTTFDGISLADKTAYIVYMNAGNEYGTYEITDANVEDNTIKLGWTIDNNVTRYAGTVTFQLTFELSTTYKWSTIPATFNIRAGLNMNSAIAPSETAVVSALFNKVNNLENLVNTFSAKIDSGNNDISDLQDIVNRIDNELSVLKGRVVYTLPDTD